MGKNSKPTQCERIYNYMKQFGSISPAEAMSQLSCYRLASRIHEMSKKKGIKIRSVTEYSRNVWGEKCHYSRYFLDE